MNLETVLSLLEKLHSLDFVRWPLTIFLLLSISRLIFKEFRKIKEEHSTFLSKASHSIKKFFRENIDNSPLEKKSFSAPDKIHSYLLIISYYGISFSLFLLFVKSLLIFYTFKSSDLSQYFIRISILAGLMTLLILTARYYKVQGDKIRYQLAQWKGQKR